MKSYAWFVVAAFAEIAGCFAVWAWVRHARSSLWILPGMVSLAAFALALTRVDATHAGRTYAAYGGVYILSSLVWLWVVEKNRPDRWDVVGAGVCILGSLIILLGPRSK